MFIPALQETPQDYHAVAVQAADLLNQRTASELKQMAAAGLDVAATRSATLAQIAQVNFLAAIAQSLKK